MILNKGKHNFWSQLLLSMIAILALPEVQATESTPPSAYQNQAIQLFTQVSLRQSAQRQQVQIQQLQPPQRVEKFYDFPPRFVSNLFAKHAPIRGSPFFFL